jgi:ligand-binding SRPBCC domain-containing protein
VAYTLQRELVVGKPIAEVFEFFSKAENLEQLTPAWLNFRILTPLPIEMQPGATIAYQLRVRGIPLNWLTEIERWNPPYEFVDVQVPGRTSFGTIRIALPKWRAARRLPTS